jgi:CheY-like chemotaxis protein
MLRDTGAFGQVRQWRLRMPRRQQGQQGQGQQEQQRGREEAILVNGPGARMPARALAGPTGRRLVIFASQGTSTYWSDGSYGAVLGPWLRDNAAVLLQLTPPARWVRGPLGDPHGSASTPDAGAPAGALQVHRQWWRMPRHPLTSTSLPLPVAALDAADLAQWARMQMARGQRHPVYLLETAPGAAQAPAHRPPPDIERTLALLKYEAPDSFRLAVVLSGSPFTLTVARLVQAIAFDGNTDPSPLAELLRSRLVVAADGDDGEESAGGHADDIYYSVRPEACELLQRSLRDTDAIALGRELEREVSRHLERLGRGGARSAQLIEDEEGGQRLPTWARPFATVAAGLLGLPVDAAAAARRVNGVLQRIPNAAARALLRRAASAASIAPSSVPAHVWRELLAARLVFQRDDGSWGFAPGVRAQLARMAQAAMKIAEAAEDDEARADLLAAATKMLHSMAMAFHTGQILGEAAKGSLSSLLAGWPEKQAALRHLEHVAGYVFDLPLTKALISGDDPVLSRDPVGDKEYVECAVLAVRNSHQEVGIPYAREVPELAQLRMAAKLLARREPEQFAALTPPALAGAVRDFAGEDHERARRVDAAWWREFGDDIFTWLAMTEVVAALARYCNEFFRRFATDGYSELAECEDFPGYLDALLPLWKDASERVFETAGSRAPSISILPSFDMDAFERVHARFAHLDMRYELFSDGRTTWQMPRATYLALIDALGELVRAGLGHQRHRYRLRVLWVDDQPANNTRERERLAELGIEFTLAESTEQALALFRTQLFDAVISDMGRGIDPRAGLSLLQALRHSGNRVPFIVYSAGKQRPEIEEALHWGVIGTTRNASVLRDLLVRALLRTNGALERPVDEPSLLGYTQRRFSGRGVAEEANARAVGALDPNLVQTLSDVARALMRTWPAVDAYAEAAPSAFLTGTDFVTAALAFADPGFVYRFGFDADACVAFARFGNLVRENYGSGDSGNSADGRGEDDASDDEALLNDLLARMRTNAMPALQMEIERELASAIDSTQWDADASSHMFWEADDVYATLRGWEFAYDEGDRFEFDDREFDALTVVTRLRVTLDAHASFTFSIKDSIDKDMVGTGYADIAREIEMEADVRVRFGNVAAREFEVEWAEVDSLPRQIDFGYVEPEDDSEYEEPDFDEPEQEQDEEQEREDPEPEQEDE